MVATSAARSMFGSTTGLFGICMSVAAAITTFSTPLLIQHVPYHTCVAVSSVAGVLSLVICTIGRDIAGPAIGTLLTGFEYAFGTSVFLSVAAFYDQRTVIAFSTGSGGTLRYDPRTSRLRSQAPPSSSARPCILGSRKPLTTIGATPS